MTRLCKECFEKAKNQRIVEIVATLCRLGLWICPHGKAKCGVVVDRKLSK
jgi:hypothetical protein